MVESRPIDRCRVVQWATGNIGTRSLREIIRHPDLDLVGLWVSSPAKVGRDAGDLSGLDVVTDVVASDDIEAVLALDADCVMYMPQGLDLDALCRILESGANVVTTRGEFHHPASLDPSTRERIEAACARGGTSIHSTGSSPGFITEAVTLLLASFERRIDRYQIFEYADVASRNSPDMIFNIMGFGLEPESFQGAKRFAHLGHAFGPSLRAVAEAVGMPIDTVDATGEVARATRDLEIAAGVVRAGTVAAQRAIVTGRRNGEPFLSFTANWFVSTEIDADWDLVMSGGWRVIVDGDCPLDLQLRLTAPPETMAETTPGYTANRAVNVVAAVCAAAPGIVTTAQLPTVVANLGSQARGLASSTS